MRLRLGDEDHDAVWTSEGLMLLDSGTVLDPGSPGVVLEATGEELVALRDAGYRLEDWTTPAALQQAVSAHRVRVTRLDARWQDQHR